MIYEEYKEFCMRYNVNGIKYNRICAKLGFEKLCLLGIFVSVGKSNGDFEFQMMRYSYTIIIMTTRSIYNGLQIENIVQNTKLIPSSVLKWYENII